jgi:ubiquinone/menaquinone biosynthesis C-methylase UbiE
MRDLRQEYFDFQAGHWDTVTCLQKQEVMRQVFNEYIPAISTPVLDVGSGTGILLPVLIDRLGGNPKIIEFDIAFRMLVQAKVKNMDRPMVDHINGDVHLLPFAGQSMATAICFESLPHFRDIHSALQELHRVLKSGGDLLILHLMRHEKLNKFHKQVGGAVYQDYLLPIPHMSRLLTRHRFDLIQAVERENLYLIIARKSQT